MNEPLISIIVPAYNAQLSLDRCIRSISNQKYQNIEIILIDDGSTDETPLLCDGYASKDNRIRIFHQENVGLSETRNRGVAFSKGEYIAFVDADDYISPFFIEYLYSAIQQTSSQLVVCGIERGIEKEYPFKAEEMCLSKVPSDVFLSNWQNFIHIATYSWNKLYLKSWYEMNAFSFPRNKYYEDLAIMHQVISKADTIAILDNKLYYYYQGNANSITHDKTLIENRTSDWMELLEAREKWFKDHNYLETYNTLHLKMHKYYLAWYCRLPLKSPIRKEALSKFRKEQDSVLGLDLNSSEKALFFLFYLFPGAFRCGYQLINLLGIKLKSLEHFQG